jgi:chromosome segregation ATPase
MISKLEIINFQSHRNTVLEFYPGVNIIIGTSDYGKSVILRALEWIINNRPLGLSFISYWNIDEKDNIFNSTICKVNIGSNIIERKRNNNFNGYIVNKKELEAIGTDIPFEVKNIFNFSDINIQGQFDSPFLLSKGAGEVARFFNKIIKIDDIDKVLSLAEKKKRKTKSDLKYTEENLKKVEQDLKELEWIGKVDILLRKAGRLDKSIKEQEEIKNNIEELINRKEIIESKIDRVNINELKILFNKVNKLSGEIEDKGKLFLDLNNLINKYEDLNRKLKIYKKVKNIKVYFEQIEKTKQEINDLKDKKDNIESLIDKYENYKTKEKSNLFELEKIKNILPDRCPLCGNKIKEDLL